MSKKKIEVFEKVILKGPCVPKLFKYLINKTKPNEIKGDGQ